jgi:hypothetical protein
VLTTLGLIRRAIRQLVRAQFTVEKFARAFNRRVVNYFAVDAGLVDAEQRHGAGGGRCLARTRLARIFFETAIGRRFSTRSSML